MIGIDHQMHGCRIQHRQAIFVHQRPCLPAKRPLVRFKRVCHGDWKLAKNVRSHRRFARVMGHLGMRAVARHLPGGLFPLTEKFIEHQPLANPSSMVVVALASPGRQFDHLWHPIRLCQMVHPIVSQTRRVQQNTCPVSAIYLSPTTMLGVFALSDANHSIRDTYCETFSRCTETCACIATKSTQPESNHAHVDMLPFASRKRFPS